MRPVNMSLLCRNTLESASTLSGVQEWLMPRLNTSKGTEEVCHAMISSDNCCLHLILSAWLVPHNALMHDRKSHSSACRCTICSRNT